MTYFQELYLISSTPNSSASEQVEIDLKFASDNRSEVKTAYKRATASTDQNFYGVEEMKKTGQFYLKEIYF